MNPLSLLSWWREILIALLVVSVGVQSYRLQGAHGKIDLFEMADKELERASVVAAMNNLKNKERTDAQYRLDLAAAHASGVRVGSDRQFVKPAPTGGSDTELACFDAGELDRELAKWAGRVAERLSDPAQKAETVAAAFRGCKAWAVNLPAESVLNSKP